MSALSAKTCLAVSKKGQREGVTILSYLLTASDQHGMGTAGNACIFQTNGVGDNGEFAEILRQNGWVTTRIGFTGKYWLCYKGPRHITLISLRDDWGFQT